MTTQISRERAAKRASFRHRTHLPTQPRAVSTIQRFATTPAGFVVCCASNTQKICNEFGIQLLRGKFARSRRSRRCTQLFALPNAALTQARILRFLNRKVGRRQEFCAAHARETRENFATISRIFGFSCAENLRDLGAERECLCRQMLHQLK